MRFEFVDFPYFICDSELTVLHNLRILSHFGLQHFNDLFLVVAEDGLLIDFLIEVIDDSV
jgi:hypothetical protein